MAGAYNYKETPKHNYRESIAMRIRDHLEDFSETGVFRYYSSFVYLLIFYQSQHFESLGIYKNINNKPNIIYDYIPLVKKGKEEGVT